MAALEDAYAYCLETLKQTSRDHYIACLLMPEDVRGHMAALYLFDVETARIRELIHEPMPGEIRLQWWRDVLESGSGDEGGNGPLAQALNDTIAKFKLPVKPFIDLLDARIFDLYDDAMGSIEDFELYAGETVSSIIQLGLIICGGETAAQNAEAAGHAGVANAVAKVLRNMASSRARGQVYVPAPMLEAAGLTTESFLSQTADRAKITTVVEMLAGFGRDHLKKARLAHVKMPGAHWPFMLSSLSDSTFDLAKRHGASVVDGKPLERGPFARQWRLWRAAVSKSF